MKETEFVVVGNERWQITRARCIKPFLQTQDEAVKANDDIQVQLQVIYAASAPPSLTETILSLSTLERMVAMARRYKEELSFAENITITGDETVEGTVD